MTKRDIVTLPDPVLRQVSSAIETVDDEVRRLLDDMLETMYDAPGIGLAAIQIGVPKRIVTIDVSARGRDDDRTGENAADEAPEGKDENLPAGPLFLINPVILSTSDERSVYEEGCLSIPDYYAEVERPAEVRVRYVGYDGREQELTADGLLATCIQHEIDHLDGRLFIDYLSKLKRDLVVRKFAKAARAAEKDSRRKAG